MNNDNLVALVVDDDPFILMDAGDILREAGFDVREAANGDQARSALAADCEDVILLFSDVEMPGYTDGFALARHVAEHYPGIEIVIASGRVHPTGGDMPARATFIPKPFSAQMVHDHLRANLPADRRPAKLRP